MKKVLLFIYLGLFFQFTAASAQCQLCNLNEDQAQKVVNYLKINQEVILYAGCANGDIARKLRINTIKYRPVADNPGYFQVFMEGTVIATFNIQNQSTIDYVETEMPFSGVVDIAYVHVRSGGYIDPRTGKNIWDAVCLGIYLGYNCDPCVDPFDYPYFYAE
ncbi:MAG: hypothetical protein NW226_11895 [Microscillaceae bacterium]|nr:hypothetical protein [Microscillaceae bacterium]